jgi:type II secretory pathway component PulL
MLITLTQTDMTAQDLLDAVRSDNAETANVLAICAESQQVYVDTLHAMGLIKASVVQAANAATLAVSVPSGSSY